MKERIMADIKKSAQEAGNKIAETVTRVGHKISEAAEKATDWAKEKTHEGAHRAEELGQKAKHAMQPDAKDVAGSVRERMEVITSCGCRIGTVDHLEGSTIKLTRNDPQAGGRHHFIPLAWVASVDDKVHLYKNAEDAMREWQPEPAGAM
jgi:hypothetical protein